MWRISLALGQLNSSRMAALTLLNGVQLPSRTKQPGILPRHKVSSTQCFLQASAERCCSMSSCSSHASASQILQSPRTRMARLGGRGRSSKLSIRNTYPEPETEKERSPLDYPQVPHQLFLTFYHFHYQACPVVADSFHSDLSHIISLDAMPPSTMHSESWHDADRIFPGFTAGMDNSAAQQAA